MKFVELWEKYYEEEVIGNLIQTPFANKRLSKKEIRALLNEEDERARNISFKELPAEARLQHERAWLVPDGRGGQGHPPALPGGICAHGPRRDH